MLLYKLIAIVISIILIFIGVSIISQAISIKASPKELETGLDFHILEYQIIGFGVEGDKTKAWSYFNCRDLESLKMSSHSTSVKQLNKWFKLDPSLMIPADNGFCRFNPSADLLSDIKMVEVASQGGPTKQGWGYWSGKTKIGKTVFFLSQLDHQ